MNEHFHNDSVTWSTGFTRIVTTLAAKQAKGVIMCNTRLAQDGSQGRCSAPIRNDWQVVGLGESGMVSQQQLNTTQVQQRGATT